MERAEIERGLGRVDRVYERREAKDGAMGAVIAESRGLYTIYKFYIVYSLQIIYNLIYIIICNISRVYLQILRYSHVQHTRYYLVIINFEI